MSRLKKLGVPQEIAPTLELLDKIADGEDTPYDMFSVVRDIAHVQYYLKGKIDGMKVKSDEDKTIASQLIADCQEDLKLILEIVTNT